MPAETRVPVTFYVGHHGDQRKATLSRQREWLWSMKLAGPTGATDLLKLDSFNRTAGLAVKSAGTYLLSLAAGDFRHVMSPKNFESHLAKEGLTAAEQAWRQKPVAGRSVRESYDRYAKSLLLVGSGMEALEGPATQRLGQKLEIVPSTNPYGLRTGDRMSASVWFDGQPLAGAKVRLTNLDRPKDEPFTARTGADGSVSYPIPSAGRWMLNTVWSVPSSAASSDFETSFSSLTFAVPDQR